MTRTLATRPADKPLASLPGELTTKATNMKTLYIVYDDKAQAHLGGIITYAADAAAIRFFTDAVKDKQTIVGQHPEDFTLLAIGALTDDAPPQLVGGNTRIVVTGAAVSAALTPSKPGAEQ